ncbi:hypothetical protein G6F56_007131 [Rhizopus delemar]|nr:hypothetical protein G6F56_007131 [Rhizopus delemar]
MVIQAQEYASRLEQAQNTIHSLREPEIPKDNMNFQLSTSLTEEKEITKGPVFSAEFRQEMQKEIERNLNLRNEIRHRIITADNQDDKKRATEGLRYFVSERDNMTSLSTSASSSSSSILSTVMKKEIHLPEEDHHQQQYPKAPMLRPASFLTGFSGFGTEGLGIGGNFIARGIPPRNFSSLASKGNEPSISTRFFQRLTSRLEDYEKKTS